jgi:hypothetical protein
LTQRINIDSFKNEQEINTYKLLRHRQRKYNYEIEYETESLKYTVDKTYIPDFILTFPSGHKIYIEYKGYLRRDDERKLISIKRQHPGIDLRIVFQKNNRMTGRKFRYSDWADKHDIPYAIGTIPDEWLDLVSSSVEAISDKDTELGKKR